MAVYRSMHIKDDTIAMIPVGGYTNKINYSADSIRWMDYIAWKKGIFIRHALNGSGEKKIADNFVDGYCEKTNTVYQYHVSLLFNTRKSNSVIYFIFMYFFLPNRDAFFMDAHFALIQMLLIR